MRLIGLDLGTKTLGVSITDKTRTITKPLEVIRFDFEDYDKALAELNKIILEYNINEVVLCGNKDFANKISAEIQAVSITNYSQNLTIKIK